MAEYIDRDALVRQIICNMAEYVGAPDDVLKHDDQCNYAISCVESVPAADVAPVVHGRWIEDSDYLKCPECSVMVMWDFAFFDDIGNWNYCPNCGAKMDGDENG